MTESRTRIRMKVLAALVLFMFGALTTRLWFLQVLASDQFSELADENQVRLVPTQPIRGARGSGTVLAGRSAKHRRGRCPSMHVGIRPKCTGARDSVRGQETAVGGCSRA